MYKEVVSEYCWFIFMVVVLILNFHLILCYTSVSIPSKNDLMFTENKISNAGLPWWSSS